MTVREDDAPTATTLLLRCDIEMVLICVGVRNLTVAKMIHRQDLLERTHGKTGVTGIDIAGCWIPLLLSFF